MEWKHLVGKVLNNGAFGIISKAKQVPATTALAKKKNGEELNLAETIQLIDWETAQYILSHQLECHAICEARDRKRNAVLGLPPTFSEVQYLVEAPDEEPDRPPKLTDFLTGEFS
jgi:hypothetical protein